MKVHIPSALRSYTAQQSEVVRWKQMDPLSPMCLWH